MRRRRSSQPRWRSLRVIVGTVGALSLVTAGAYTAANSVPPTNVDDQTLDVLPTPRTPPSECDGMTFDVTGTGTGVIAGSLGNDWIIGSDQADTISGLDGNDCIEGKAGGDIIDGGPGEDVCIGGDGTDTFLACETQIQ